MSIPRVLLGAESLAPGNGGICRVARLIARVLGEEAAAGHLSADAVVLSDTERASDLSIPQTLARKSRLRYVYHVRKAALNHTHFIYDFQGMSRAHLRFPFLTRPMMTYIHGIEVWETGSALRARTARRADVLVSNTAYTRQRADQSHGGFARAKVCHLATEEDLPPTITPPPHGPPVVLVVGRLDELRYKGHAELIECWDQVVREVPDARLWIVGKGPGMAAYQAMAHKSPASANIEFKGFVPDGQMPALWAQARIFAMPSRYEGFGLVYIEAMRYGVPVIASVHDAAPEVNVDGQTGYNVNLDQSDELPRRLVELLKDSSLCRRMGEAGRQRWQTHFSYSAFKSRFLPCLQEFLKM